MLSRRRRDRNSGTSWLSGSSGSGGSWSSGSGGRADQSGALSEVTQLRQVVVDLEGTGAAVAIAAAVQSFRNITPAPHGKVEVEGEAQDPGDNSS